MVVIDNPYFIRSVVANTAGRFGTNISGYPAPHKKHDEPIQYDDRFKWILPPVMDNTLIAQPIQLAYYDTSYPNVRGDGSEDLQIYVKIPQWDGRYELCPVFWMYNENINKYELHNAYMQPLDTMPRKDIMWSYRDTWTTSLDEPGASAHVKNEPGASAHVKNEPDMA